MKLGTKALLITFISAAAALYAYLYLIPGIEGMSEETQILEYGELPILDKTELLIVRDETLFGSKRSGSVAYEQEEGAKVRKGVRIASVEDGAAGGGTTSSAAARVRKISGDAIEMTDTFTADKTAVVSYYADGYEGRLSVDALRSITRGDLESCPDEGKSLKTARVAAGDPVYKLTNNNEWYMIYWKRTERGQKGYSTGAAVTVNLGDASVDAEIYDVEAHYGTDKVILRSDMYYEDLTRVRKAAAEIVFSRITGLIADSKNIVRKEGASGVFVKQRGGGYKWVPVYVIAESDGKSALSVGVYNDQKEGKQVDTVNYYDEILADPNASDRTPGTASAVASGTAAGADPGKASGNE
jgi:hypothetical protein